MNDALRWVHQPADPAEEVEEYWQIDLLPELDLRLFITRAEDWTLHAADAENMVPWRFTIEAKDAPGAHFAGVMSFHAETPLEEIQQRLFETTATWLQMRTHRLAIRCAVMRENLRPQ